MCGIVGVVGKITAKEENAFKILSKLDTIRGEDSTGICSVTKSFGDWAYLKDVGTAFQFFETSDTQKLMNRSHLMLFGHNRAATKGVVNADNAHPFLHGDYVGCHNGTLWAVSNLEDYKKFDVDSENIYYDMSINGHLETLKKLRGAFALCWYNSRHHTVNLVRNSDRPLYTCNSTDGKTMFWASEAWMLHVALSKLGLAHDEPKLLEVQKLLTIDVPIVGAYQTEALKKEEVLVEFYKEPVRANSFWSYVTGSHEDDKKAKKESKKGDKEEKVVPINRVKNVGNYNARFMSKIITFSCCGLVRKGNLEFLKCELVGVTDPAPELRVFTPEKSELGENLLTSPKLFQGKVKAVTVYGNECYLVCDNRTIHEIEENEEEIVQQGEKDNVPAMLSLSFTGFKGEKINLSEYLKRTSTGCMCCGNVVTVKNADELMWVGEDDYFCQNCKNTQLAAQYSSIAVKR